MRKIAEDKNITIPSFMLLLVIYNLGNKTITDAFKILDMSPSQAHKLNLLFLRKGWIEIKEKDKRSNYILLTEKGKHIANIINTLLDSLEIKLFSESHGPGNI